MKKQQFIDQMPNATILKHGEKKERSEWQSVEDSPRVWVKQHRTMVKNRADDSKGPVYWLQQFVDFTNVSPKEVEAIAAEHILIRSRDQLYCHGMSEKQVNETHNTPISVREFIDTKGRVTRQRDPITTVKSAVERLQEKLGMTREEALEFIKTELEKSN